MNRALFIASAGAAVAVASVGAVPTSAVAPVAAEALGMYEAVGDYMWVVARSPESALSAFLADRGDGDDGLDPEERPDRTVRRLRDDEPFSILYDCEDDVPADLRDVADLEMASVELPVSKWVVKFKEGEVIHEYQ